MKTVNIDKFGRVLIPKKMREQLGLTPGEELALEVKGQKLWLEPCPKAPRLIRKGKALIVSGGPTLDDKDWSRLARSEHLHALVNQQ